MGKCTNAKLKVVKTWNMWNINKGLSEFVESQFSYFFLFYINDIYIQKHISKIISILFDLFCIKTLRFTDIL